MSNRHRLTFTAGPGDIDVMGHVNNAVWVQWMEAMAVAHWEAVASAAHQAAYVWVVTRHEIDYRGNIAEGESVTAETFIPEAPSGARFDRRVDFTDARGKVIVSAKTTWALLDKASGRLLRVPKAVAAPFLPDAGLPDAVPPAEGA
ncbi:acyl-CoA thioesterase [Novosphingobium sp. KCTC 2891]|uniref:acyl-CoA thioesterase n=1 Tax=Novosphingobium sp. KCTC 2891 TaxID=2989730 RepID=UPI002223BAC3|nr:acyl-CoA thioesterase [Novosphingobium sp. KCTC 2891]MCW1382069.1 acyl-CoA thioesterase [Novosphingobium sp. KCTC 2891]